MKFYHGTSLKAWEEIKKEGVLWGGYTYHETKDPNMYRYTYLTPHIEVAEEYAKPVLLAVEYEPVGAGSGIDNFGFNPPRGRTCWQFSVFVPISVEKVRRIDGEMNKMKCPECEKEIDVEQTKTDKTFPFCSQLCKNIDLYKWFNGEYKIVEKNPHTDEGD